MTTRPFFRSEVLDLLLDRTQNNPDKYARKFTEEELIKWRLS
ncbi:hypothetical protein [Chamaesiphon sp. VAR_48_metabat_403]|nr:hypothetical protein [Chamaesiphon sp. VAR_48_metabat_403]